MSSCSHAATVLGCTLSTELLLMDGKHISVVVRALTIPALEVASASRVVSHYLIYNEDLELK